MKYEKYIEKTWIEKYKSRNDLFWRYYCNKRLEILYYSELLKQNPCIPRKFLPNCNGKETLDEKNNVKLDKRKGTSRITITKT